MITTQLTHLIIGNGEVGNSLYKYLLNRQQNVHSRDRKNNINDTYYDIIHICYGYSKTFIVDTKEYIKQHKPKYIIIHSTVPLGTTRKIHKKAIHSPICGIHPYLEESIGIFAKFFGGQVDSILKKWIELTFDNYHVVDKPDITEALKLWCTTAYGVSIILEKEIHSYCKKHKLPFSVVYDLATQTYNDGYFELGCPQYIRPILKHIPGKIGGHCVIQNCKLLDSPTAKKILKENSKF